MTTITDPTIDSWYKDVENNLSFKVVAIDEINETIEVQYITGDIGQYEKDSWYNSTFDFIEAPEDWSAPYELEQEDLGYTDPDKHSPENVTITDYLDQ